MRIPRLIGMVHLAPLPGSSRYGGSMQAILHKACQDAATLEAAGFEAVMIENFGDAPFFASDVPAVTIAALAVAVNEISRVTSLPLGVNVLRNDAEAAVSIAAATGAAMIRVNVLSGMMYTDQGPIVGRSAEVSRIRAALAPETLVLADIFVKHATAPPGLTLDLAAADTWERGGADALILSGTGTGRPVDPNDIRVVRQAVPKAPLIIGSGASAASVEGLLELADGVIVGSALKPGGDIDALVDPDLARAFVAAAG